MNIKSKIEIVENIYKHSDKDFKAVFASTNSLTDITYRTLFNICLCFEKNDDNNTSLYDRLRKFVEKFKNRQERKSLRHEPLGVYENKEITKFHKIYLDKNATTSDYYKNAKIIINIIESLLNYKTNIEFLPTTILYQHLNSQDNDSVYRLFNNRLLMKDFYMPNTNYPEGIYRLVSQYILNSCTMIDTIDNINTAIILNNQLNFGYFLNNSIFKHKAIFEKPHKKSIAYDAFVALIERNVTMRSPLEVYENKFNETEIIYKTSELSRIKSDDKFQASLRNMCDYLGFRASDYSIMKIAKRQLKIAYSQKIIYSHLNNQSKTKHKTKSYEDEILELNDTKYKARTIETFEQMIDKKYIKTYFWNSCCCECIDEIRIKNQIETIQLNQRVSNGLELIKNISNALSELWIASFAKEFNDFDGMLFQALNSIVVEIFDLKRILNNNTNLENIKLDTELISLIKEYGLFIKRVIDEGIYTTSKEGLRLISITESFVNPLLSSFVTTTEFKDIHFEVFYVIDELFSNANFTRILFKFLLCYYNNYSAADSVYRFNTSLTQMFPYKASTIKRIIDNKCNFKEFIKEIQSESYYWQSCIDIANIYLLTPFSMLATIATSRKSLMYRCLKILNILNTENKVSSITYLNNIWKANVMRMPWTNFQVLNKKIVNNDVKGNSRVNEIIMTDSTNTSIKELIEKYVADYVPFIKNELNNTLEDRLLNAISKIYDKDYNYIYFNRSLSADVSIDAIRISFNDLRFSKYGYLFCVSNVQPKAIVETPICFHYSMIPEFEMSVVGTSDGIYINDNRHPVYYKFNHITIFDKSDKYLVPVASGNIKSDENNEISAESADFILEIKASKGLNPYIELCGTKMRKNILPITDYSFE